MKKLFSIQGSGVFLLLSFFSCNEQFEPLSFNKNQVVSNRFIYQSQVNADNSPERPYRFSVKSGEKYNIHIVMNTSSTNTGFYIKHSGFMGLNSEKKGCIPQSELQCSLFFSGEGKNGYDIFVEYRNRGEDRNTSYSLFTGIDSNKPVEIESLGARQ